MKIKVFRKIHFNRNYFLDKVTHRFQYAAFTSRQYIDVEGESIVYTIPDGIEYLKVGSTYEKLEYLYQKSHEIKAKAIIEVKKRREQRYYLKKEGKPKWDKSYKNPPKKRKTHR